MLYRDAKDHEVVAFKITQHTVVRQNGKDRVGYTGDYLVLSPEYGVITIVPKEIFEISFELIKFFNGMKIEKFDEEKILDQIRGEHNNPYANAPDGEDE